jgi:hypothetical protein
VFSKGGTDGLIEGEVVTNGKVNVFTGRMIRGVARVSSVYKLS